MGRIRTWWCIGLTGLFLLSLTACFEEPAPPPPVKKTGYMYIGLVAPQTGPLSDLGRKMIRGAEMAVDAANAEPNRQKRKIKLLIEDERGLGPDPGRLARDIRVSAMVGHALERTLEQSLPHYAAAGRPVLLPLINAAPVSDLAPGLLFRLGASDEDQAGRLAEYAAETLKTAKMWAVREDSVFGLRQSEAVAAALKGRAGVTLETVLYPEDPGALTDLAGRAAKERPGAVILALHARRAMYFALALKKAKVETVLLGTQALAFSDVVAVLNRSAKKAFVALPVNYQKPDERAAALVKGFEKAHHRAPTWPAMLTHDAVAMAAWSLGEVGDDPKSIRRNLAQFDGEANTFQGWSGRFYFQPAGRGVGPIDIVPTGPDLMGRVP